MHVEYTYDEVNTLDKEARSIPAGPALGMHFWHCLASRDSNGTCPDGTCPVDLSLSRHRQSLVSETTLDIESMTFHLNGASRVLVIHGVQVVAWYLWQFRLPILGQPRPLVIIMRQW